MAARRQGVGGGLRNPLIMSVIGIGVTQKEDRERGVDQEHVFHSMGRFLAARGSWGARGPVRCHRGQKGEDERHRRLVRSRCPLPWHDKGCRFGRGYSDALG
jgi:hypothetical protein